MELKINKQFNLKIISVFLALFIATIPFFQPKKAEASVALLVGITGLFVTGMIAGGYARDTVLTPEQINNTNDYCTANLQAAFPDPAEYNKQLGTLQNLDNDIRAGKDIDWSKYSGKALYAVLKGVVDVVWPYSKDKDYTFAASAGFSYAYRFYNSANQVIQYSSKIPLSPDILFGGWEKDYYNVHKSSSIYGNNDSQLVSFYVGPVNGTGPQLGSSVSYSVKYESYGSAMVYSCPRLGYYPDPAKQALMLKFFNTGIYSDVTTGNSSFVDLYKKTSNKVKLPTRLPQTVINNINNYYNGDTENLTIAPTPEELPTLPDDYNPVTDELPDIPGYVDVTSDQEPTTDPEPTPTPPDPTPIPEGDYNGDHWVNPTGDFFDGLLKFMKAAFIPTLNLNLDALSSVPDNLGEKFPFSLPSDIIGMVTMFQAEPVPIEISFNIPTHIFGYQDIPIKGDTSFMDDYMPAIRNLIFLLFLFSLAWSTFNMFFGGGDD